MSGFGDRLASGSKTAVFPASDGKISQARWDEAFKDISVTVDPESQIMVSEAAELEPPEDVTHP